MPAEQQVGEHRITVPAEQQVAAAGCCSAKGKGGGKKKRKFRSVVPGRKDSEMGKCSDDGEDSGGESSEE